MRHTPSVRTLPQEPAPREASTLTLLLLAVASAAPVQAWGAGVATVDAQLANERALPALAWAWGAEPGTVLLLAPDGRVRALGDEARTLATIPAPTAAAVVGGTMWATDGFRLFEVHGDAAVVVHEWAHGRALGVRAVGTRLLVSFRTREARGTALFDPRTDKITLLADHADQDSVPWHNAWPVVGPSEAPASAWSSTEEGLFDPHGRLRVAAHERCVRPMLAPSTTAVVCVDPGQGLVRRLPLDEGWLVEPAEQTGRQVGEIFAWRPEAGLAWVDTGSALLALEVSAERLVTVVEGAQRPTIAGAFALVATSALWGHAVVDLDRGHGVEVPALPFVQAGGAVLLFAGAHVLRLDPVRGVLSPHAILPFEVPALHTDEGGTVWSRDATRTAIIGPEGATVVATADRQIVDGLALWHGVDGIVISRSDGTMSSLLRDRAAPVTVAYAPRRLPTLLEGLVIDRGESGLIGWKVGDDFAPPRPAIGPATEIRDDDGRLLARLVGRDTSWVVFRHGHATGRLSTGVLRLRHVATGQTRPLVLGSPPPADDGPRPPDSARVTPFEPAVLVPFDDAGVIRIRGAPFDCTAAVETRTDVLCPQVVVPDARQPYDLPQGGRGALGQDGRLALPGDGVHLLDLRTGSVVEHLAATSDCRAAAWGAGNTLAALCGDRVVTWHAGRVASSIPTGLREGNDLHWSPMSESWFVPWGSDGRGWLIPMDPTASLSEGRHAGAPTCATDTRVHATPSGVWTLDGGCDACTSSHGTWIEDTGTPLLAARPLNPIRWWSPEAQVHIVSLPGHVRVKGRGMEGLGHGGVVAFDVAGGRVAWSNPEIRYVGGVQGGRLDAALADGTDVWVDPKTGALTPYERTSYLERQPGRVYGSVVENDDGTMNHRLELFGDGDWVLVRADGLIVGRDRAGRVRLLDTQTGKSKDALPRSAAGWTPVPTWEPCEAGR